MYRPVQTAAPDATPLTIEEAKKHLNVEHADDDSYIESLIAAAVARLDGRAGILRRCLMTQTWRQDFDCFARSLLLPLEPVSAIGSVTYKDASGVTQTVAPSSYALLEEDIGPVVRFVQAFTVPAVADDGPAVSVTFTAGYGDEPEDVPQPIRHALLLLIADWYQNRETMVMGRTSVDLPVGVDALLAPYRPMMV